MRSPTSSHLLGPAAALLLALSSSAACQSSTPQDVQAVDRSTAQTTYFAQFGASTHAYKPRRLDPSVDGSLFITQLRWRVWTDRRAVGRGIAHVNDCRPDCADGHYSEHRVTVRLARPKELCGSRFFTVMAVMGSGYRTYAHKPGVGCQ